MKISEEIIPFLPKDLLYTITARYFSGNINSVTGRFILDIPDIELVNFFGMPNPFNNTVLSGKDDYRFSLFRSIF